MWENHNYNRNIQNLRCPGYYCGRRELGNGNISDCGSCPSGTRVNTNLSYICQQCTDTPSSYDLMYLLFMALIPLLYHSVYIDISVTTIPWATQAKNPRKKTKTNIVLNISAILEVIIAAVITVLSVDPVGEFVIRSCPIKWLSDWYTVLYNPTPYYLEPLRCTQEAVYPLYSMVFIFYFLCVITLLMLRPPLCAYFSLNREAYLETLYSGLYFFPIAALIHAFLGGVIYVTFPYIVIVISVISSAIHYAGKLNQSAKHLIVNTVCVPRNMMIVALHWVGHGFGIVAITQLANPPLDYALLLLVPLPTIFYIATTNLSEPSKILVL